MKGCGLTAISVAVALGVPVAASADDAAAGSDRLGCVIRLSESDARGAAGATADCRWALPYTRVAAIVHDQEKIDAVLSSVADSSVLPDGRVLQVHSLGFGTADRQVTLDFQIRELPKAGIRLDFRRAASQEPLGRGRVAIAVDEGFWQVRSDGPDHTQLRYRVRYDPGGRLEPWLLRRFLRSGVTRSLEEVRRAAERPALAAANGEAR